MPFRMIVRYRRSKLSGVGSEYPFGWKTFCAWDYSVNSRAGVIDQRTALKTEIKVVFNNYDNNKDFISRG